MERRCAALPLLQNSFKDRTNRFFVSPWYIFVVLLLSAAAHLLAAELVAYTVFALIAVYVCLVGNDFLPIAPLLLFSYILPSANNNPGKNEASIFSTGWFLALAVAVVVSFLIFFIRNIKKLFSCKRSLIWGMLALCAGYLLSGIFSEAYGTVAGKNLLFAALQCSCVILPYFLLSGGVDWRKVRKDYLAWVGVCAGVLLLLEVFWSYRTGGVIIDGVINRKKIFTGWGMYNNLGAMLAMMIPFAFCLGTQHHKGWLGMFLGGVFLLGVVMTCSRASMIAALGIYVLCSLIMLFQAHNRRRTLWCVGCLFGVAVVAFLVFHKSILQLYSGFLDKITDPSSRHILFAEGWKVFKEAPVFGSSFYSPGYQPWDFSTVDAFSSAFPPRWHNTFIQLLASCGVVGLLAYIFHRFQTVKLFFRRKGILRNGIGCSIAVLLVCCLLDCHFFNLGPVLFYSAQLAFLEFVPSTPEK